MFDVRGDIEGNIAPNMQSPKTHTHCDDKICLTRNSVTVGYEHSFGSGLCPGTMLQSHLHQHIGAINGTMYVNGEAVCTSFPTIGADPNNAPGDELGYVVGFNRCIDIDNKGNAVRLNKGDVLPVDAFYDVDEASTLTPFPGGKHSGVMSLFF